jgi:RNA polymerase sigma-32 factor
MTGPRNGRTGWRTKDANQAADYAEKDEYTQRIAMMEEAMDVLNERERDILTQRRLQDSPVTLEDLSGVYNVSRERIRQIEVRAFEKLQNGCGSWPKNKACLPRPDATNGS